MIWGAPSPHCPEHCNLETAAHATIVIYADVSQTDDVTPHFFRPASLRPGNGLLTPHMDELVQSGVTFDRM